MFRVLFWKFCSTSVFFLCLYTDNSLIFHVSCSNYCCSYFIRTTIFQQRGCKESSLKSWNISFGSQKFVTCSGSVKLFLFWNYFISFSNVCVLFWFCKIIFVLILFHFVLKSLHLVLKSYFCSEIISFRSQIFAICSGSVKLFLFWNYFISFSKVCIVVLVL